MNNLLFRLLTALVAVPLILAILYMLPWWGFGILAGAAMCVGALEFFQMSHKVDRVGQAFGLLLSLGVFVVLLTTNFGATNSGLALATVLALVPAGALFTLFRPGEQTTALARMSALTMG